MCDGVKTGVHNSLVRILYSKPNDLSKEPDIVLLVEHLAVQHVPGVRLDELQLEMITVLEQELRESVCGIV